jgi:peptidoglycan/LPS O-acetylase OafA/YrhL
MGNGRWGSLMGTVRFLLALCVVVTHSPGSAILGFSLLNGITAVQCFYVISGFLITMVLNQRAEYQNLRNFYLSRYLRLWPTYAVVALLSLIFFNRTAMFGALPALLDWPGLAFVAFSNLTLFFQDWFLFARFDHGHLVPTANFSEWPGAQVNSFLLVPQCWSIGVELTFYAIAPFVCRRWWSLAALAIFGGVARAMIAKLFPPFAGPWLYRFAPSEMLLFGSGGLAYFISHAICPRYPEAFKSLSYIALGCFSAVVFGLVPSAWLISNSATLNLMLVPVSALLVVSAGTLFYGMRDNKWDQYIGELSYPMYVSHIFVMSIIVTYLPMELRTGNLAYVVLTITFSVLLYVGVTIPADALRKRFGARVQTGPVSIWPKARVDGRADAHEDEADQKITAGDLVVRVQYNAITST